MVVDLRSDAPTAGRGLYHGGDTGSHVANPDALSIKSISNTGNQSSDFATVCTFHCSFCICNCYSCVTVSFLVIL